MCSKAYLFTISVLFLFIPTNLKAQSYIYWGDKKYKSEYVATFQKYYGNSMNPISMDDISMEVGRKTNGGAVMLLETEPNWTKKEFDGSVYLYLRNGQRIRCVDRNLNDKVDGNIRGLYFLTRDEVRRLKKEDIVKIRYSLKDQFSIDSYTANNNSKTSEDFIKLFGSQDLKKVKADISDKIERNHFESTEYSYSLEIPLGFSKNDLRSAHMDMNFSTNDGSSINMVVVPLSPKIKGATTDDISKGMILNIFKRIDPNARIVDSAHTVVNGEKSFYYVLVYTPRNASYKLKHLVYAFYNSGNRFVLTMTSGISSFSKHKSEFRKTAQSINFKLK